MKLHIEAAPGEVEARGEALVRAVSGLVAKKTGTSGDGEPRASLIPALAEGQTLGRERVEQIAAVALQRMLAILER